MEETRDPCSQLSPQEIEAIKTTQDIIKRMAENSAKTKTIFIAVTAAMGAFLKPEVSLQTLFALLVYLALTVTLWHMDASYLQLERKFRSHSNAIVSGSISSLDRWLFNISKYKAESVTSIMMKNFTTRIYRVACVCSGVAIAYIAFRLPC